jgi:hypothetical protein
MDRGNFSAAVFTGLGLCCEERQRLRKMQPRNAPSDSREFAVMAERPVEELEQHPAVFAEGYRWLT